MTYRSTKTFGHELGLSCAFRQWRADSHCRFIHGYALRIRLEFEADELNELGWVVDFGGLRSFRDWLEDRFDHTVLVAKDDPQIGKLLALQEAGIATIVVLPAVGCEQFAAYIGRAAQAWLAERSYAPRVKLVSCEVSEHGANSAIYLP